MLKFFRSIHNALRRTTIKTLPVIELTPRHFVRSGHMPCLDPLGRLPQLLAYAIGMSMEQKENPLVIFGHADAEGSSEERRALSMRRAMAVRALVRHDIREWMELSSQASIEEISLSLAGVAGVTGWDCNTNQQGHLHAGEPSNALAYFQSRCVAKFGTPVQVDGLYSLACWHGVYHIVVEQIKKCLQREFPNHYGDGSGAWMAPSLGLMDGSGVVGCGSDFPLFRPDVLSTSRRVDLVCTPIEAIPNTAGHENAKFLPEHIPIYDSSKYQRMVVDERDLLRRA